MFFLNYQYHLYITTSFKKIPGKYLKKWSNNIYEIKIKKRILFGDGFD